LELRQNTFIFVHQHIFVQNMFKKVTILQKMKKLFKTKDKNN